jgi:hypothetical protein
MKYLADGRKVIVIGQLNNIETIVQEIFINDAGDEIPSGERFVVKSLHDSPVISWQAKEVARLDKWLQEIKDGIEKAKREEKEALNQLKAIKSLLAKSKGLEAAFTPEHVERIAAFMTGQIEYLLVESYEIKPPVKMIDKIIQWDSGWGRSERSYEDIKLISVLGKSNCELGYKIHKYSDGSGSSDTVYPCLSLDEAKEKIKERALSLIEVDRLSEKDFEVCKSMGIEFDEDALNKYNAHRAIKIAESKKCLLKDLAKLQESLAALENGSA